MRHLREGRKLNRTSSHRKALLNNLATALFQYKKIETTEAKAKELRPFAERLITKAKHALLREKQGGLPEGQTIDIHNRRIVGRRITNKAVLQELFDTIAPAVENRNGGYTRIIKTGARRGDGGDKAIIELVDWSAPQDGASSLKKKKKTAKSRKPKTVPKAKPSIAEAPKDESSISAEQTVAKPEKVKKAKKSIKKEDTSEGVVNAETIINESDENPEAESQSSFDDNSENNNDSFSEQADKN